MTARTSAPAPMRVRQTFLLLIGALFFSCSVLSQPRSLLELRSESVVRQSDWFTCGPAAVATLLTYTYGQPTTEQQALTLALTGMQTSGRDPRTSGLNALALQHALAELGLSSQGMRVSLRDLRSYFEAGGLPVIAHVTRPQLHYVVLIGVVGKFLVITDSSWGRRLLPVEALEREKGFQGTVLVPLPTQRQLMTARERQTWQLAAADQRLNQLGVR